LPAPYGWRHDANQVAGPRQRRRIVRHDEEGAVIQDIRERYLAGGPTVEICRDLHRRGIPSPSGRLKWSTDALLKVLRSLAHAGLVTHRGEHLPGAHAELRYWSPEEHEHLEQRIAGRASRMTRGHNIGDYPLSTVLYCEHCGRRLVGGGDSRRQTRFYGCTSPRTEGSHTSRVSTHEGQPRHCPGVSIGADDLEEALRQAVAGLARSAGVQAAAQEKLEQAMDNADERLATERAGVERRLRALGASSSRLFGLLDEGAITQPEFEAGNARRGAQQDSLTARRDEGFTVVTVRPAFADPIELRFVRRPTRPVKERGPDVALTERQLALLALWDGGLTLKEIATGFDVCDAATVGSAKGILYRLGVGTLDEAVELKRDTIARCRATLPLRGRVHRRHRDQPDLLTPPLLQVVRLLAEGKRAKDIAEILGKDKSTISHRIGKVRPRPGVSTMAEAVARGREPGPVG
jgi:DNA-binding NarL/FixJ family response regulator